MYSGQLVKLKNAFASTTIRVVIDERDQDALYASGHEIMENIDEDSNTNKPNVRAADVQVSKQVHRLRIIVI